MHLRIAINTHNGSPSAWRRSLRLTRGECGVGQVSGAMDGVLSYQISHVYVI